ncbi:MAG: 3'-5' exonuclease [Nanoarchaeota archaeon]|nr:3'-5' exonuclease [Nanoarchaeota archaeon]
MKSYVVLDIETTGLSKHRHKITEIAAVKIKNKKIVDKFHTLINPEVKIPSFITRLTGIDNELVKNKPLIHEVLPNFLNFLENEVIVAHCATFDYGFLLKNCEEHNLIFNNEKLCTRKLANRLLTNLPSKKLSCLCEYYDLTNETAHRALSDTLVTAEIFSNFLDELSKRDIKCMEDVFKFEQSKIIRD